MKRHIQHGRDPWLGPAEPIGGEDPERIAYHLARPEHPVTMAVTRSSVTYTGADTLSGDISLLPDDLNAYMSYVDNFGGFTELKARFATGGTAGLPWGYTSAGNMASLVSAGGGRRFVRWSAHYGFGPHICGPSTCGFPQADWTQWDDHGAHGENIDRSLGTYLPAGLHGRPLLVPITIFGGPALCADMEPGAMQIGEFGGWYDRIALHPAPLPVPVLITIPEDPEMLTSYTKHKTGEQERAHIIVAIPKTKGDLTKGVDLYEVYQQANGADWVGAKPGVKALAYHLASVPSA